MDFIRPCPPTKKMASNSLARPAKEDNFAVFFHNADWLRWKSTETESSLEASTEAGSRGASPPAGEATVMSATGLSTCHGCANSGRYQPVGLPVEPSSTCEVRMKRILGLDDMVINWICEFDYENWNELLLLRWGVDILIEGLGKLIKSMPKA
jgi:hypothetical protein